MQDLANTLHVIGDMHMGGLRERRKQIILGDLQRDTVPAVAHTLNIGDMTGTSGSDQDSAAVEFMDALSEEWFAVVGNHDVYDRTPEDAAVAWGKVSPSWVEDLGYATLIGISPKMPADSFDHEWLDARLAENSDRPCVIACHYPLLGTVGSSVGPNHSTQWTSVDESFYARNDDSIRAVLAEHPQVRAWISGHTHSPFSAPDLVKQESVGSHYITHINASAIHYTTKQSPLWTDWIATCYVSVGEEIEVRFRDHGRHQWLML